MLTAITGHISGWSPGDRDLYEVCLTGEAFSATTSTGDDPGLWVFDPDGKLVTRNDDIGPLNFESSVALSGHDAGTYYLAIAHYYNAPLDAANVEMIFPGDGPLDHWYDFGGRTFDYSIALSGVRHVRVGATAPVRRSRSRRRRSMRRTGWARA